jgi:hypothetical protein
MTTEEDRIFDEQAEIFDRLYNRIEDLLERFGRPDTLLGSGDYSVYGDYMGHPQVKVSVNNLRLLRPSVVTALQSVLDEFPGWEIVVAVAVRGHYDDWPDMGLIIRGHEIIDGLQRQYFPPEFRDIQYEGSRPGTDRD